MDDEKDDVFFSSSSSFSAGAPLLPAILPSTAAATTTRATQAGVLFEDDAAGGRCRRARRGRFAARRPRTSHGYSLPLVLPRYLISLTFFSLRVFPLLYLLFRCLFFPDHGIISLKAHGGEGTTKEERLPYEATVYVPPRASSPPAPLLSHNPFLFPSHASHPRRLSWRTRQVCPSSLPSACAFSPSSLSLYLSRVLSFSF